MRLRGDEATRRRCGLVLFFVRKEVWLARVSVWGFSRERSSASVSRECHVFLLFPLCHLLLFPFYRVRHVQFHCPCRDAKRPPHRTHSQHSHVVPVMTAISQPGAASPRPAFPLFFGPLELSCRFSGDLLLAGFTWSFKGCSEHSFPPPSHPLSLHHPFSPHSFLSPPLPSPPLPTT